MNSNWFKLVMKMTKVEYGKNLLLKGVPIIFNKGGAKLKIGENVTIKSSFLSNLVGLYSRVHGVSASTMNDDAFIMKTIREITSRGNNAEVKRRSDGRLAVYEVKKSITIG